jgi:hypothetical protein
MLDTFFAQAKVRSELARTLHDEGFGRDAVRRRIRAAEHLVFGFKKSVYRLSTSMPRRLAATASLVFVVLSTG